MSLSTGVPTGQPSDVITTRLKPIFDQLGFVVQADGVAIVAAFIAWQRAVRFGIGDPVATIATYTAAVAQFNTDLYAYRAANPTAAVGFTTRDSFPLHID